MTADIAKLDRQIITIDQIINKLYDTQRECEAKLEVFVVIFLCFMFWDFLTVLKYSVGIVNYCGFERSAN